MAFWAKLILDGRWQIAILFAIIIILFHFKKESFARFLTIFLAVYSLLIYSTPLANILAQEKLKIEYPNILEISSLPQSKTYHIVILGTSASSDTSLPSSMRLHNSMTLRLIEGMRIFQGIHSSKIITTGTYPGNEYSHGKIAAEALLDLGIPIEKIEYIEHAETTEQEAYQYAQNYPDSIPVILVSDFDHLPRAMAWFERYGIQIIPAPAQKPITYETNYEVSMKDFQWDWNRMVYWNTWLQKIAADLQLALY